jgi:hypothetical protein
VFGVVCGDKIVSHGLKNIDDDNDNNKRHAQPPQLKHPRAPAMTGMVVSLQKIEKVG